MDAAGIELEESETDLRQLAQDVVELLSPRAHTRGLDVCVRASRPACRFRLLSG